MAGPSSEARGRALVAERSAEAARFVRAVPEIASALLARPARRPRSLVTTGIGTSEGHARHLAALVVRTLGLPARFASTGSLASGAPSGSERDWLVVFSQGLSPNARHALGDVEAWGGVVLVTGLSRALGASDGLTPEKSSWLASLEARGVVVVELGCGAEYGALLRVVGARVGYAVAWSLARALAARWLDDLAPLAIDPARLERAQREASAIADRLVPPQERIAAAFGPERALVLVGAPGALDFCHHLAHKLTEGLLRPLAPAVDVLELAHGPLQSLADRPATIVYLDARFDAVAPAANASDRDFDSAESPWRERLVRALDPALHRLLVVRPTLALPFAAVELEAIFDAWILRYQAETRVDWVEWPGRAREASLYDVGPAHSVTAEPPQFHVARSHSQRSLAGAGDEPQAASPSEDLSEATWPEVEQALAAGRRTAIVALGSIEQHGPHLPLATDRWIADALAQALAARRCEAIALPAIAFGCASEHLDFPGTLHVEPATLEAMLGDLLGSLVRHRFERAFVFSAHGGNLGALREMAGRVAARVRPLEVAVEVGIDVAAVQAEVVAAHALAADAAGPHAGEYETSLVAWLRPGSVRRERLAAGPSPRPHDEDLFYPSLRPHAPQGVLGDPTRAARRRGFAYLAAWVDALEDAYCAAFASEPARAEKNRK